MSEQLKQIDLKYGWLMSLILWGSEVDVLGDRLLAQTKDRKARADLRRLTKRSPGALEVPIELTPFSEDRGGFQEGFGANLVRALLIGIKEGIDRLWGELRSMEIVIE